MTCDVCLKDQVYVYNTRCNIYLIMQGGCAMKQGLNSVSEKALKVFRQRKVMMLGEVAELIDSSIHTARRRLKEWQTYTSYNQNGRYYALPDVAEFDANGIWVCHEVFFSKYGNLKNTVIELIGRSQAGLDAAEIHSLLKLAPRSFLSAFAGHPRLRREKIQGRFVYFCAEPTVYTEQRHCRNALSVNARQPTPFEAIAILVEKIKRPALSDEDLSRNLKKKRVFVDPETIRNLFIRHGLSVKKNATFDLIGCLSEYRAAALNDVFVPNLFAKPPLLEFRPSITHCSDCGCALTVLKTRIRQVSTLHVGQFQAREVQLVCKVCGHTYRSEELCALVPPGANFGYDVMVYAGRALFLRYRNETEVVAELAEKHVLISPREVSLLGMKFIVYLAMTHQQRVPEIRADMQAHGGYICHLDATCEGRDPLLMSSIDSLSQIVLGNVKIPSENEAHIVPFLERIRHNFGVPLALVHDMGKGILKAVENVFPGVPDYICHFHFLRDIGKDFLGEEYDIIRKRLRAHSISTKLRYRAKQLKTDLDQNSGVIEVLCDGIMKETPPTDYLSVLPVINGYTLINWALQGKSEGQGYGFPFDHPHLAFATRLHRLYEYIENIEDIHLRGIWRDNRPYYKIHLALKKVMNDKALWNAVEAIEQKIEVFEKLREAMRIAPQSGGRGLNDEGGKGHIHTIEKRVNKFRTWVTGRKDYDQDKDAHKMIKQIDKYWDKLFADPIAVQTPSGTILIQPQRTNNILEQFFRTLKRSNRRRTGNASSSRMLQTMLAETPLVQNLKNPAYMQILLNGKASLEEVFATIEIEIFRKEFQKAQDTSERIPAKIKALIALPDLPVRLLSMVRNIVA